MDIRELLRHLRETESDRAVQRALGIDRRTVQRYRAWASAQHLLTGPLPAYEDLHALLEQTLTAPPPPQMVSSVEPFRTLVVDLLAAETEIAAIYQRLRERGFTGSYSAVRRFVQTLHPTDPNVTVRVETAPAEEAQVDFGYAGRMIDPTTGALRKAWAFVMTLCWSRHQYLEFVWDQTIETWLLLHVHAFNHFGGVPARIKLDNLKAAITKACVDDPLVQRAYRECAEHYGFLIDPCRPATPEHKGKVESGVHYVKRNLLGGRPPTTLSQANQDGLTWCMTTAGLRQHGTIKAQPLTLFREAEQAQLRPLPSSAYDLAVWKQAALHRDCYVVFNNAYYSAPFRLVNQQLWVRGGCDSVRIYTQDWQLVATHVRACEPGQRVTHPDHLPPTLLPGLQLGRESCRQRAAEIGPATCQVVETLLSDPVIDRLRTVGRLLGLAERFSPTRLEAACARALVCEEPTHRMIKAILEQGLDEPATPAPVAPPAWAFLRSAAELLGHVFGGVTWN